MDNGLRHFCTSGLGISGTTGRAQSYRSATQILKDQYPPKIDSAVEAGAQRSELLLMLSEPIRLSKDKTKDSFDAQLATTEHDGRTVPAIALTEGLLEPLRRGAQGSAVWHDLDPVLHAMSKSISAELKANLEEFHALDDSLPEFAPPNATEFQALRHQRAKLLDRKDTIKVLIKTFEDEEVFGPGMIFENKIFDQLRRAGLISAITSTPPSDAQVEHIIRKTIESQEALSSPGSEDTIGTPLVAKPAGNCEQSQEPFPTQLEKARAELIASRIDPSGRQAQDVIIARAEAAKQAGYKFASTDIVHQYALIERTEPIGRILKAEKKYRDVKDLMREQGIRIERVLSDDSEFSQDITKDEPIPEPKDQPGYKNGRKRGRAWIKQLESTEHLAHVWKSASPPDSTAGSRLPAPSVESCMTAHQTHDTMYNKRAQMWNKMQRERTRSALKARVRSSIPKRKTRTLERRLNAFLTQRPDFFRVTNNTPRHPSGQAASRRGSSRSSSEGDFEFWDRFHDPGPTAGQSTRIPIPSHAAAEADTSGEVAEERCMELSEQQDFSRRSGKRLAEGELSGSAKKR